MENRKSLLVVGGVCGLISIVLYATAFINSSIFDGLAFPTTASQPVIVYNFWSIGLFGVFAIINSYAIYRLLAWEKEGTLNRLAFLFSVIGFSMVTLMVIVQNTISLTLSKKWHLAINESDREYWQNALVALDGLDLGIDLTWDLFISVSIVLTGWVMYGHSRFKRWFAFVYGFSGIMLFLLNAVAVPWPPVNMGLFDMGPVIALINVILCIYMIRMGMGKGKSFIPLLTPSEAYLHHSD